MTEISKRLSNSLNRIQRSGGVVLIHHTSEGATDYQLANGGGLSPNVVTALREKNLLIPGQDGLFGGDDQTLHTVSP